MGKIKPHLLETIVFLVIILILSLGSYSRNKLWSNPKDLWTDCLKKSPHKSRPYTNLGLAYSDLGEYDEAVHLLEKAVQLDQKDASAYFNYGIALQKKGEINRAIGMLKKSLEIDPTFNMPFYTLGVIYFEKGEYKDSMEAFKKFVEAFPFFPEAHHSLGIAYAAQKQFDQAVAEFESEIRINPYHILAHINAGQIYWYEFHNREKAIYHLRAALMLDPFLPNRSGIQRLVRLIEELS